MNKNIPMWKKEREKKNKINRVPRHVSNINSLKVPEDRKERNGAGRVSEEIGAENFPHLKKNKSMVSWSSVKSE